MSVQAAPGRWTHVVRDPVAWAYAAAVALGLVQAVLLGEPARTLRGTLPYLLALTVVVAVRVVGPRDDEGVRRWLAGLAVAGGVLAAWLLAGLLAALPDGIGAPHGFYRVKLQVTSPVGDHNTAAGLLLPSLVAAAALAARDRRWLAGLLLVMLGVAATLSRGAVAVLLVVAAAAWVVGAGQRLRMLLAAAAGAALVVVLALSAALDASPPPDGPQAEGVVGASVVARADLVVRGLEVGLDRPSIGVGVGGFGEVASDLPPPNDHAHQLFAHALAEGGVLLLAVALLVITVLLVRAWRLRPGTGRDVLLLGGAALVVHAQLEILGGRGGYEVVVALLATLAAVRVAPDRAVPGA
jgi:O-antigen ligase